MKLAVLPDLHHFMPEIASFAQCGVKSLQIHLVLPYIIRYRNTWIWAFLPAETRGISKFGKHHDEEGI